jgi:hypothetical protein
MVRLGYIELVHFRFRLDKVRLGLSRLGLF